MLDNLLKQFGSGAKEFVGVSLNANGLLEVAVTSHAARRIQKYTNRRVNYNAIARKIEDPSALGQELDNAFNELRLNPKNCNVSLSLPNVYFSTISLKEDLTEENIRTAMESSIDDSYLFKGKDGTVSWSKLSTTEDGTVKYGYSAIQSDELQNIKEAIEDPSFGLGATLISVQNSYSTMFEALAFSNIIEERMLTSGSETKWNALFISSTSYSIFCFNGTELYDYVEDPLAIKSYTAEEVYSAVAAMACSYLQNYPAENLLIISDTDDISAEILSHQINFNGHCEYIEQNKFQQNPILEADLDVLPTYNSQITATAIGASVDHFEKGLFKFNYLSKDVDYNADDIINIGGKDIEINPQKATILAIIVAAVVLGVLGGICFAFNTLSNSLDKTISELRSKESSLKEEMSKLQTKEPTTNISTTIDAIIKENRKKMLYYDALSYGIPDKLWVTYFHAGANNAVAIYGVSQKSGDIALFLKGIREVAGESGVSVSKLTMTGDDRIESSSNQELYSFQLTSSNFANKDMSPADGTVPANNDAGNTNSNVSVPNNDIPPADKPSTPPPVLPADE